MEIKIVAQGGKENNEKESPFLAPNSPPQIIKQGVSTKTKNPETEPNQVSLHHPIQEPHMARLNVS